METAVPSTPQPGPTRPVAFQALLLLGGLVALLLLLIETRGRLGPFWAVAAGVVVLWPIRQHQAARAVLGAGGMVFGAYLLSQLGGVLAPFIGVFVLAYLLDPAVTWAQRRWRVPRWASTLVLTGVVVGAVVVGGVLLVPVVIAEVERLVSEAVGLVLRAPVWVEESRVLAEAEEAGFVDRAALVEQVTTFLPGQIQAAVERIPAFVVGIVGRVGAVVGLVTTAALVPVLLFFCLKDYPMIRDGIVRHLPRYRGRREYLERAAGVFGNYVRGQLTISAISAVLVAVPLALFGVPFSLLLGLLAGLLNMIPSLGSVLTYVLGVTLMLVFGSTADLFIVLGVLAVQAIIEQALLTPNIMSQQVGLHPVAILLALFVCGALFGLLGLILAVPATALLAGALGARREALVLDLGEDTPEVAAYSTGKSK